MWRPATSTELMPSDLAENLAQLRQSSLRRLIVAVVGLYLLMQLALSATWPSLFSWPVVPVVAIVFGSSAVGLFLTRVHVDLAHVVWQIGLSTAVVLAALTFQRPEPLLLLAFQPFMFAVIMGWPWGGLAWLLVTALVAAVLRDGGVEGFTLAYAVAIVFAGALGGVLGWAAIGNLVTVAQWLHDADRQSRQNLQDARQHRSKLLQAVKELDQANYRLVRINAALATARHTAEEALRFKAEFVANVSHELRTPLNLIIGFSEVMILSPESYGGQQLPGAYRADINAIYNNARHLKALVDDVLDMGRIDAGKLAFTREPVEIQELLLEVDGIVGDYIAAKGLTYAREVEPGLPALTIDRVRVRQVLLNLLVNAVRFTESGSIRLEVARSDGTVRFAVFDSGRGIGAEELSHVFEPFHTSGGDGGARWFDGKGLGLPISKKYVEMHGGKIGAESVAGRGSTFWFTLPVAGNGAGQHTESRLVEELRSTPRPLLVAAVGDGAVMSRLQRSLDAYQIEHVADLRRAVAVADELEAVAIVTDENRLPAADVVGALPQPTVPVIACQALKSTREESLPDVDITLTEPVPASQLLAFFDGLPPEQIHTVLIADENPDTVRLLRRVLRARVAAGTLLEAYNGEEVLQRLRDERPSLALVDVALCDDGGVPVLTRIAGDATVRPRWLAALVPAPALLSQGREVTVTLPADLTLDRMSGLLRAICSVFVAQETDAATAIGPEPQAALPG
ncbi:MAG: hypothetical protein KDE23_14585 [Caldilinea sp.]|nr:hypothetical protein [Caldilinea sp.]